MFHIAGAYADLLPLATKVAHTGALVSAELENLTRLQREPTS